jgi:hypothetical protein
MQPRRMQREGESITAIPPFSSRRSPRLPRGFPSPATAQKTSDPKGADEGGGVDRGIRQVRGQEPELPKYGEKGYGPEKEGEQGLKLWRLIRPVHF